MKSIIPPSLIAGDKVALIAPAKKFERNEISDGIKTLQSWGLEVVEGKNIYKGYHQFSANDDERLEDLQNALDDPSIKAIFAVRGGYGTSRIIDKLSFKKFKEQPKWIIGYSDITVLHTHLNRRKYATLHSIMPLTFGQKDSKESVNLLKKVLFGENLEYKLNNHPLNREGKTKGEIVGGNLSILNTVIGTRSEIKTKGKILFLEDIGEYLYHLDRMMVHLKRSGKLEKLSGLIVGHFTDIKDGSEPFGKSAYEIIQDAVEEYDYPVCFGFPAGHEPVNHPLIFGQKAKLIVSKKEVSLTYY
ncbi:MAG TPA: LD-carboxypeptidase [Cytophagaceae bacterium]